MMFSDRLKAEANNSRMVTNGRGTGDERSRYSNPANDRRSERFELALVAISSKTLPQQAYFAERQYSALNYRS
jgi:hypothetical protein